MMKQMKHDEWAFIPKPVPVLASRNIDPTLVTWLEETTFQAVPPLASQQTLGVVKPRCSRRKRGAAPTQQNGQRQAWSARH